VSISGPSGIDTASSFDVVGAPKECRLDAAKTPPIRRLLNVVETLYKSRVYAPTSTAVSLFIGSHWPSGKQGVHIIIPQPAHFKSKWWKAVIAR
jgi:hypothetical protein